MMQAVILAGGLGTRLRPLTLQFPKPLVPVAGAPYLEYQLRYLRQFGISRALLLIGYLGEQVRNHFGDGGRFGMDLQYCEEKTPLGTGGALRQAIDALHEEFFLIYGDSFLPVDYADLERVFRARPVLALMTACENSSRGIPVANNVAINETMHVTCYEKGGARTDLNYVEAGVHALRKQSIGLLPPAGVASLEEHLFPELVRRRALGAYICPERFYDIGTMQGLKAFEQSRWVHQ